MTTAAPREVPDQWDYYPTLINDQPASVMTNLWYRSRAPIEGYPYLGWVFLRIEEPAAHGMGSERESRHLGSIEDQLATHLALEAEAHFVGRVRGQGLWQLYFYCPDAERFRNAAEDQLRRWPARSSLVDTQEEPDWQSFHAFLAPDEERLQWILDGRVVSQLEERGDPLDVPRRVDHWLYFPGGDQRETFRQAVQAQGFQVGREWMTEDQDDHLRHGLIIHREDTVQHEDIHRVVLDLSRRAREVGGEYDGWETPVVRPSA